MTDGLRIPQESLARASGVDGVDAGSESACMVESAGTGEGLAQPVRRSSGSAHRLHAIADRHLNHTTTESARARVTSALKAVNCALPSEELSRMTGVPLQQVKNLLARCDEFLNVGSKRHGMYVYVEPKTKAAVAAEPAAWKSAPPYRGEKPLPTRPGSNDFLSCGSVQGGEVVERRRPVIMGSSIPANRRAAS